MNKVRINCMTYTKLKHLVNDAIELIDYTNINPDELDIEIINSEMRNIYSNIKECIKNKVDVFVAGGAYANIIKTYTDIPIVEIIPSFYDHYKALKKASQHGKTIGVAIYDGNKVVDFEIFEEILNIKIKTIIFSEAYDIEYFLENNEIDALIGASVSNDIADKFNIPNFLIYGSEKSIAESIEKAYDVALRLKEEKKKNTLYKLMFNYNTAGLIILNEYGHVVSLNLSTKTLLTIKDRNKFIGKHINYLFNEINLDSFDYLKTNKTKITFKGRTLNINCLKVSDSDNNGYFIMIDTKEKITEEIVRKSGFKAKYNFSDIAGESKEIKNVIQKAKSYARTDSNILILGNTGVGKELFAQSIHNFSYRSSEPFVAVNCASIQDTLLESELFGYEEGAFTGSKSGGKKGLFEIANGGTIFLDEISELPLALQAKLLRVIQENEVIRIGGEKVINIDTRVISASNKLLEDVDHFRKDLFYRLAVLQISIPNLREREDDIFKLFNDFINEKDSKINCDFTNEDLYVLKLYSWPGNIRQLKNIVQRFIISCNDSNKINNKIINNYLVDAIGEKKILKEIFEKHKIYNPKKIDNSLITEELLKDLEILYPRQKEKIASLLGISRTTLWRILN